MFDKNVDSKHYEPSAIDLKNRNSSHTLIVELTGCNKTVLEVGTSTGYLSKILKKQGNRVIGVEIDGEAAAIATQYCDQMMTEDIETLVLENYFEPHYFDVVIFGDVLEHLRWPNLVLEKVKRHLKPKGYLVVSLPNIAHGDIILNLLVGKFRYTKLGLLDITHLRFFALDDIIELFENSGYQITDLQTTTFEVGATEANIDLNLVPKEVLEMIKILPHAQTYQFVFRAYLKEYGYVNPISLPKADLTEAFHQGKDARIAHLEGVVRDKEAEVREKEAEAEVLRAGQSHLEGVVRDKEAEAEVLRAGQSHLEAAVNHIYNSHGWKALLFYYRIRDKLLPYNSKRRMLVKLLSYFITNTKTAVREKEAEAEAEVLRAGQEEKEREIGSLEETIKQTHHAPRKEDELFTNVEILKPSIEKNRILIVDRFLPEHDRDSGSLRIFLIVRILTKLGYRVTFLPDDLNNRGPYASDLSSLGVTVSYRPIDMEKYLEREGPKFSYVILSMPEQAFKYISLVRAYAINSKVIYDTVDLHWVRFERSYKTTGSNKLLAQANFYKPIELLCASCSDMILTVTPEEKEILLRENPGLKVEIIPTIHNVASREVRPFLGRKDVMFVGGYSHQPNEDAALFFISEIFPLIKQALPDVRFFILGSNPSDALLKLNSKDTVVTGYVKDLKPYFDDCCVFVAPLRYGAGMKGEIGQSMSYGLPVVTTKIGAEGIGLEDNVSALIADDPKSFAEAVIRLYTDETLWRKCSEKAFEIIENDYTEEAVKKKISNILNSLKREGI